MNLSKKDGRGSIDNKQPTTKWDQEKLKIYQQDCSTPVKLQQKVFTDMMLHFCRRGRENPGWRAGNQVYNSCVYNFNMSL